MLEFIRDIVLQRTEGLTDGQFFGFGIIITFVSLALILMSIEAFRNWRTDFRLRRRLKRMPHGGLGGWQR